MNKHSVKRGIDNLNNAYDVWNFTIPENKVVQFKDTAKSSIDELKWDEHASLYIGKVFQEGKGIYNEQTLKGMLSFAAKRLRSKDDIIQLQVGGKVYDLFANPQRDDYDALSHEEQMGYLEKLIASDKTYKGRVKLIDVAEMHPTLFSLIKHEGVETLFSNNPSALLQKEDMTSTDIASYFYTLCQHNELVRAMFIDPVPGHVKKKPDKNFYYTLVELSTRIHDFLHGMTTQGGMIRQEKFDQPLLFLTGQPTRAIDKGLYDIPEIKAFQEYCQNKLQGETLKRWYFENGDYLSLLEHEKKKEALRKKVRNIVGITAIAIASAIAGGSAIYSQMHNIDKKKQKEKQEELIKQKLKYEKLGLGFHSSMDYDSYTSDEKKIELVEHTTDRIYNYILKRYSIDPSYEEVLKSMITEELVDTNAFGSPEINTVNRDFDRISESSYSFIENVLIKNHPITLSKIGFDTRPYSNLLKNKGTFETTAALSGDLVFDLDKKRITENSSPHKLTMGPSMDVTELGEFGTKSYDQDYILIKISSRAHTANGLSGNYYEYIVAKSKYDPSNIYTTQLAKKVAQELLSLREQKKEQQ